MDGGSPYVPKEDFRQIRTLCDEKMAYSDEV